MSKNPDSAYDEVAEMYHALWDDWYLPAALPALENLLFRIVPPGSRILDLCCGSGHVTQELIARGYEVTGIDNSAGLIGLARKRFPDVDFRVQDARALKVEETYDAALSTFDSLNHLPRLSDLKEVFRRVRRALARRGRFVFDMNLAEAYTMDLEDWVADVDDDSVGLVRGSFDFATKTASTELIWFTRDRETELWRQRRSIVEQYCYPQTDIMTALAEVGFRKIESITAEKAGFNSDLGSGRVYFVANT